MPIARLAPKTRPVSRDTSSATAELSTVAAVYIPTPLADALAEAGHDEYDALPEPIKEIYSRKEYLWLTDEQKAGLIDQECEPEW